LCAIEPGKPPKLAQMTYTVEVPMPWAEAVALIKQGTVESLGKLARSQAQLAEYRSQMAKVLLGPGSSPCINKI